MIIINNNIQVSINNIARGEVFGSAGFLYDIEIGNIRLTDFFEHDTVIFNDCVDSWFDVNGVNQIRLALDRLGIEDNDDAICRRIGDMVFATLATLRQ